MKRFVAVLMSWSLLAFAGGAAALVTSLSVRTVEVSAGRLFVIGQDGIRTGIPDGVYLGPGGQKFTIAAGVITQCTRLIPPSPTRSAPWLARTR